MGTRVGRRCCWQFPARCSAIRRTHGEQEKHDLLHRRLSRRLFYAETTDDGAPVHSFRTMLADLATIVKNTVQPTGGAPSFDMTTTPTALQKRALDLLAIRL
jgi:hypothetical protein